MSYFTDKTFMIALILAIVFVSAAIDLLLNNYKVNEKCKVLSKLGYNTTVEYIFFKAKCFVEVNGEYVPYERWIVMGGEGIE